MLRNLLADRFKLVVHRELREMSAYALVKVKADGTLGPQMRRSGESTARPKRLVRSRRSAAARHPDKSPSCGAGISTNAGRIIGTGTTIFQN